jgi:Flp pilus assembly protein TadG
MRQMSGVKARRLADDRGAVMVEAALVTPLLVFLLFGTLEFGLLFRSHLTLNNATQAGARAASIAGNQLDADYRILQNIKKESGAIQASSIERIVIYHAASTTDEPSAGCTSGIASTGTGTPDWTGACNVYTYANFADAQTAFGCGTTQIDRYWCPTSRKTSVSGPQSPPDFLGVWIQVKHNWVTGLFGNSITLNQRVIVKLEPKALSS